MDKPHLSKFVFEAFDPVHEAGKQARWYGVLAEFQKGPDGEYRKVLSQELTLAQLEARGFSLNALGYAMEYAATKRAEAAEAQVRSLTNDLDIARVECAKAKLDMADSGAAFTKELADRSTRLSEMMAQANTLREDLQNALGARDNFAALEKKARGEKAIVHLDLAETQSELNRYKQAHGLAIEALGKIPRWTRRLFGAI